jgi:short-subunit dehydrogenase
VQVEKAITQVYERFQRIDVLVNNAGVIQSGPLEHMTVQDFQNAMDVHLWASLYTTLAVIPYMRGPGGGRIINIASIGGLIPVPHLLPYVASKFALVGLSKGLRAELARDNIVVTTVCPGLMRTGSHMNAYFKGQHEKEFAWFALLDTLPVSSTDVRHAAHEIIKAAREGKAQLIITLQARLAYLAEALLPELTASGMSLMTHILPKENSARGDMAQDGWRSRPRWLPTWLTYLGDRAAEENNELRGHTPPLKALR